MKTIDITGQKFGRLTARARLPSLKPGDGYRWECDCDCGAKTVVLTRLLTYKNGTKSCGCILREKNQLRPVRNSTNLKHGHTSRRVSPEYRCWSSMIQRCTNPKHVGFQDYGGRGIEVCASWAASFESFLADMGPRPDGLTIERRDTNKGYSKGNCYWATRKEQANNKRNNHRITAFGVTMTCEEMAALHGIPTTTLYRWSTQSNGGDIGEKIKARLA